MFKDTDNMSSSRFIKIRPADDKLPEANLYVDVIRKVKNRYMCTAIAEIPFAKESYATDDHGLHKIEYTYEYAARTGDVEARSKAEMAAWLWASSPVRADDRRISLPPRNPHAHGAGQEGRPDA